MDIVLNVERYAADPKDEFELETASEFESVPLEQRQDLARRYQSLIGGFRTLWYRPTLIDTIRIAHAAGKILLPLELLIVLDKNDHDNKKRYIESVNESDYGHSFVRDMYRL